MRYTISLFVAGAAIAVAPAGAMAPGPGGMNGRNATTAATSQSPTGNGGGYNHMNSPQHATGQPSQSCQDLVASGQGAYPGNSSSSPGSPFNETSGKAGGQYAGSQPQNSRNTASVSQYDVACSHQPH